MFLRHIHAMLNRERTVCRTIGDVRLEVVQRGRQIVGFKLQHNGGVPDLLSRFSPEVQEQARQSRWSSSRERGLRNEARKIDPLSQQVVEQVILHDRAVIIERGMQRAEERQRLKDGRLQTRQPAPVPAARSEPDYAAMRAAGMSASEIYAHARGVEPVQPSMVATRTRSR
jgi:hypothetical protein